MDFSEAVQWWEEWQLRVLALASLFLQYFLYFAAPLRKRCIPSWFRFTIWLAYLGSDAVAIYALAALFNRHTKQGWVSTHRDDARLQALWAPILLVHLGGVDVITAYNIEDNELWRRYVLTSISQIAVAIYVFHKSGSSGDNRLLQAAIFIFGAGVLKCFEKPVALRSASISSLMSRDVEPDLPDRGFMVVSEEIYYPFIDRRPPRSMHSWHRDVHDGLRRDLSFSFDRLYTKEQVSGPKALISYLINKQRIPRRRIFGYLLRTVVNPMIFIALGLFHSSHKGAYNSVDVKVTYALLSCTASLEYMGYLWTFARIIRFKTWSGGFQLGRYWPDQIAQYNLIGYLASKRKHRILTSIAAFLGCEDYLDPLWCMKPCESSQDTRGTVSTGSRGITGLVGSYIYRWCNDHQLEAGANNRAFNDNGSEPATNRAFKFNDNRGHWTLMKLGCGGGSNILRESLRKPFDESVLLWHLATEFCYLDGNDSSKKDTGGHDDTRSDAIRRCKNSRIISNYMAYLLLVNPEMLMTGARPSLFRNAYMSLNGMLPNEGDETMELAKKIIQELEGGAKGRGVIDDAWALYKELEKLCNDDSDKMWELIQGVWVEMLCFSASRCRGYLHAKSLGKGGEYLSYIWLLLQRMGMETLADKMQTAAELPEQQDHGATSAVIGDENV